MHNNKYHQIFYENNPNRLHFEKFRTLDGRNLENRTRNICLVNGYRDQVEY